MAWIIRSTPEFGKEYVLDVAHDIPYTSRVALRALKFECKSEAEFIRRGFSSPEGFVSEEVDSTPWDVLQTVEVSDELRNNLS